MSTTLPPTIDRETLPRTPAKEWANDVTSALHQPVNNNDNSNISSTPAHEFPGAYPSDRDTTAQHVDLQQVAAQAKETGLGMLGSAKQYLPAQENVQSALAQAGETAKLYLNQLTGGSAPSTDHDHDLSLPSAETTGAVPGEKTTRVGSPPGAVDEAEVAKLPEESTLPTVPSSRPHGHESLYSTRVEPSGTPDRDSGSFTSSRGVGDLPGNQSEVGVGLLRLADAGETNNDAQPMSNTTVSQQTDVSASPLSTSTTTSESKSAPSGKLDLGKGYHPSTTDQRMLSDTSTRTDVGHEGVGVISSPTEIGSESGSKFAEGGGTRLGGHGHGNGHGHGRDESGDSSGSGTLGGKPKFMNRVKGEAKVFVGKIGGDIGKVEEGRRMMGKSPTQTSV